jgi:hypothetical protein
MEAAAIKIENAWRAWWAGCMQSVGGQSLLAPLPVPPSPGERSTAPLLADFKNVLDGLDSYFAWMKQLRRQWRDGYDLFSRAGGVILKKGAVVLTGFDETLLEDRNPEKWPAFGMVSFTSEFDDEESISPKLLAFRKMEACKGYVPLGNAVAYFHVVYFFTERNQRLGLPQEFYVGVKATGEAEPLKAPISIRQSIRSRRSGRFSVYHSKVDFPATLHEWNDEWCRRHNTSRPIEAFLRTSFYVALNFSIVSSQSGVQVSVTKGTIAARFNVSPTQTAKFFRHRDLRNGKRRIFHAVVAHQRTLSNGNTIEVCDHYRGARKFDWKDYRVTITIPDVHHKKFDEFTAKATDEEDWVGGPYLDSARLGGELRKTVEDAPEVRFRKGEVVRSRIGEHSNGSGTPARL